MLQAPSATFSYVGAAEDAADLKHDAVAPPERQLKNDEDDVVDGKGNAANGESATMGSSTIVGFNFRGLPSEQFATEQLRLLSLSKLSNPSLHTSLAMQQPAWTLRCCFVSPV
jgi:hypothetical protein